MLVQQQKNTETAQFLMNTGTKKQKKQKRPKPTNDQFDWLYKKLQYNSTIRTLNYDSTWVFGKM